MDFLEKTVYIIDYILDTKKKRHVTGGILLSASLFFGGLAYTVITTKEIDDD